MAGRLQRELQQRVPFAHAEVEAFLNLVRTADHLERGTADLFKAEGLSHTGYNILRILRGAGEPGLPCGEIASRLVTHDPDITRLLDRLEARGLVARGRTANDRRQVIARITPDGLALAERLAPLLNARNCEQLGHLGAERLAQLIALLEAAREQPQPTPA